jgi:ATP-dependent DNA ligase
MTHPQEFAMLLFVQIADRDYTILQSSEVLDSESKKGRKFWRHHVLTDAAGRFYTASEAWQDNGTGPTKTLWSTPYYAQPTNVGRANAKTNEQQAFFDFASAVQRQRDKRQSVRPLPMLAQSYTKLKHWLEYPCAVQPKYDGMRVLYDGETAWSRGNKAIIPEVFQHLHFDTQDHILDGELILPDNPTVNETMRAAKKFRAGLSDRLVYRVYDVVDATLPFGERLARLERIVTAAQHPQVILADTRNVATEAEALACHAEFTEQGYEGSILRNYQGRYEINKRSNDLLKFKDFVDAEYRIVDVVEAGGGSSAGVGKFICETADGTRFESTATGSLEQRRAYLTDRTQVIGKWAKVKYRELSGKNAVPFHSNVLEVRDTQTGGY